MVSHKLQQVSAPFASGVNPKVTGGRNLSLPAPAANDDGPESEVAATGTNRGDNIAGINVADAGSADLPACAIDIAQALCAGWLELWYQPKIGSQALDLRGAEALIRMRHPQLGIVQPANFMPAMRDPHFRALSQFVIARSLQTKTVPAHRRCRQSIRRPHCRGRCRDSRRCHRGARAWIRFDSRFSVREANGRAYVPAHHAARIVKPV
jgi:hypothetical protein